MTCSQVRVLLSFEPRGVVAPQSAAVRAHLEQCDGCRRFWLALQGVDAALAARPLAKPPCSLTTRVMAAVDHSPRHRVAGPFSRAFWVFCAALTLLALVGGAWVLQHWSGASLRTVPGFTIASAAPSTWPNDASAWLSFEGERMAQAILAALTGLLISVAATAIGFRASARGIPRSKAEEPVLPPH